MFAPLLRLTAAGLLLAALARPAAAQQADTFWVPPGGTGNWFTAANWAGPIPNAPDIWAQFGQGGTGSPTVTLNGNATLGRLTTLSSFNFTVAGANTLTITPSLKLPIIEAFTSGNFTIQAPVALNSTLLYLANNGFSGSGAPSSGVLTVASLTGLLPNTTVRVNANDLNYVTAAPSPVVLESANFSGTLQLGGGVFRAADGVGVPTTVNFQNTGGYWEQPAAGTVTRSIGTGAGQMQLSGTTVGFGGFNGPVTFNFGNGATVVWGAAGFTPGRVQFGRGVTAGGNDSYTWQNPIDLNGAVRTVAIGIGSGAQATLRMTGPISGGAGSGLTLTSGGGTGAGAVELTGTNTYAGPTTVSGTFLRAVDGVGLSPNSVLVLQGGGVEGGAVGSPTFDRPLGSGPGQVRMPTGQAQFTALGSAFTVQIGGGAAPTTLVWGSADFNPAGLTLGSARSDALTDFRNPIDLNGGVRFFDVRNNPASTTDVGRFSGVISNSGPAGPTTFVAVGNGNGVVEFAAANTYNMQTAVTSPFAGAGLRLVGGGSFANSPLVAIDTGETLDVSAVTAGANFSVAASRFLLALGQTLGGTGTVTGAALIGPGATVGGGSTIFTTGLATGQLTVAGPLRLVGSEFAPAAALRVDLTGVTTTGATVSRVAVTGAGNTFDLAATAGPGGSPVVVRLANDGGLTAGQSYSFTVASAAGGFTRDGNPVSGYNFGSDFRLESATFAGFSTATLLVSGQNLVLTFTPVPEPAAVLAVAAAGLAWRRWRAGPVARTGRSGHSG